eukprot:TRINITY_DN10851_c0_g1_i1.p1 TRINITY_DN10851_c0_g1~~TRINITY_DN10851_c0_g1_i1.p1  ORF type:complete len:504 (+),score=141.88 TRINITY_DN10851_c0_g1_i1:357-1868(+)
MNFSASIVLLVVALLCANASAQSFHEGGPIDNLPGYVGPPLNMSSGYITVDQTSNRSLFYWFVAAEESPETAPLVFWTNGGPGCSGLIGLFTENGPFAPMANGSIGENPFTWQKIANMIFIEQPAGVGFSYSNNATDYNTDDQKAAADNYEFIQLWLQVYTEFSGRDFWITAESYGGVYVPTFTDLIVKDNTTVINQMLKGIMIGNPVVGCKHVDYGNIQFQLFYWHGLVSWSNYDQWNTLGCNLNSNNTGCASVFNDAVVEIGIIEQELLLKRYGMYHLVKDKRSMSYDDAPVGPSLDPDNLYQDFCTGNASLQAVTSIGPCTPLGNLTMNFLNQPIVQKAIHATAPSYGWTECSPVVNYSFSNEDMIPYYYDFFALKPELSILIYSGDIDIATCPFAQTQPCLAQLNGTAIQKWRPWYVNGVTVGYTESFDRYTYATIKGAGHEAPEYQPLVAFNLFERFLTTQNLTDASVANHAPSTEFHLRPQAQALREARASFSMGMN